nr:LysR family transcriptional regulator [Lactobacillus crispatus]
MTLEQLRIFVAVAEQEHVTRAAQTLNLTQSATSAAIAALVADWVRLRVWAARVTCSCSATATKMRNCSSVIVRPMM